MCKLFPSFCHPIKETIPLYSKRSATTVPGKLKDFKNLTMVNKSILHMKETMIWKSIEQATFSFLCTTANAIAKL